MCRFDWDPVKNRDTSELNEFVALIPMIIRITPPTSRDIENSLFIMRFQCFFQAVLMAQRCVRRFCDRK